MPDFDLNTPKYAPPTPAEAPAAEAAVSADGGTSRFRILRQHAKGGLGVVYLAHDAEVNRQVALKEIQFHLAEDRGARSRFKVEAEITGGLEHPGIVPVYGLGQHDDGRPYYAMRFIQGDSLAKAIAAFHAADVAGRDPVERNLALRQLLRRFIDVCNTIDYAHSKGVLHRDLKPDNIMVGSFGETLVVDWGLAKVVGQRDALTDPTAGDSLPSPTASADVAPTQAGSVVGTPAFMSPEQAAGRIEDLGPASDIYSLGATLYNLLTGQPPFTSFDGGAIYEKIQRGEFPRPSAVKKGVDRVLEAICLKAMAPLPTDRYPSAKDLAADLDNWSADEPTTALAESRGQKLRRWMRRHPGPVAGAVAAIAVAVVGLGIGALFVGQKNEQLSRTNRALDVVNADLAATNGELVQRYRDLRTANVHLDKARRDAEEQRDEADRERKVALAVRDFLNNDLLLQADASAQADRLLSLRDGKFETAVNPTIRDLLDRAAHSLDAKSIDARFPKQPAVQAEILATVGYAYRGIGDAATAIPLLKRSLDLRQTTFGDAHPSTLSSKSILARAYLETGNPKLAASLFEEALAAFVDRAGADHVDSLTARGNLADAYRAAGMLDRAISLYEQTLASRIAGLGEDHPRTLVTRNNLALAYQDAGRRDEAIPLLERTYALQKAGLGADHPNTLTAQANLAGCYQAAGKVDLAIPLLDSALKTLEGKLGVDHPRTLVAKDNLASAYRAAGQLDRAIALLEEARAGFRDKLGVDHPDALIAAGNLASAYRAAGRLDRAIPLFEQTYEIRAAKLGEGHPDALLSLSNLAIARLDAKEFDRAVPLFERHWTLRQKSLGEEHPDALASLRTLTRAYAAAGRLDREEESHGRRIAILRKKHGPEHAAVAAAVDALGECQLRAKKFADAERSLSDSHAYYEAKSPDWWGTFDTKSMLGAALAGQRKFPEAEKWLLAGYEGLKARSPKPSPARAALLAAAAERLATLYADWDRPDDAVRWRKERDGHLKKSK